MIVVNDKLDKYQVTSIATVTTNLNKKGEAVITLKRINIVKRFLRKFLRVFSKYLEWTYPLDLIDRDFIHMPLSYNALSDRLAEFGIFLSFETYQEWRVIILQEEGGADLTLTKIRRTDNKLELLMTFEYPEDVIVKEDDEADIQIRHRNRDRLKTVTKNRNAKRKRELRKHADE